MVIVDSDTESESGEFGSLFRKIKTKSEIFYFRKISYYYENNETNIQTQIQFTYSLSDRLEFRSKLLFPGKLTSEYELYVVNIGMCNLLWYYMGFGTENINIQCYDMSSDMIIFWQDFYNKILLEYKYMHTSINLPDIILSNTYDNHSIEYVMTPLFDYTPIESYRPLTSIPSHLTTTLNTLNICTSNTCQNSTTGSSSSSCNMNDNDNNNNNNSSSSRIITSSSNNLILCPLGGGKDSLVVWNRICQLYPIYQPLLLYSTDTLYEYESNWRIQQLVSQTKHPLHIIRHEFKSELFEKSTLSYLYPCGHPWAALILFDSLLICKYYGISKVWLGYEKSADIGNHVYWKNQEVNHQYDKSSQFMQCVQQYIRVVMREQTIEVISALSHMWEIEIMREFCQQESLKPYHPIFLSCNEPTSDCQWCNRCEKCCFIYLLASAWLLPTDVSPIFLNTHLYDNHLLLSTFMKLIDGGPQKMKPMDCVGTFSEASAAIELSLYRYLVYYLQQLQMNHNDDTYHASNISISNNTTSTNTTTTSTTTIATTTANRSITAFKQCDNISYPTISPTTLTSDVSTTAHINENKHFNAIQLSNYQFQSFLTQLPYILREIAIYMKLIQVMNINNSNSNDSTSADDDNQRAEISAEKQDIDIDNRIDTTNLPVNIISTTYIDDHNDRMKEKCDHTQSLNTTTTNVIPMSSYKNMGISWIQIISTTTTTNNNSHDTVVSTDSIRQKYYYIGSKDYEQYIVDYIYKKYNII